MINEPLNSNEQSKIILFFILSIPSIIFGVGIIPMALVVFAIYIMRKNSDFTLIETVTKTINIYIKAATFITTLILIGVYIDLQHIGYIVSIFIAIAAGVFYLFIVNNWFYLPLNNHRDWVAENGIFATNKSVANEKN